MLATFQEKIKLRIKNIFFFKDIGIVVIPAWENKRREDNQSY